MIPAMNRVLPPAGMEYECTSKVCGRRGKTQKKIRETDCTTGGSRKTWQLGIDLVLRSQVQTHGAYITCKGRVMHCKVKPLHSSSSLQFITFLLICLPLHQAGHRFKPGYFVSFLPWVIFFLSPCFFTKVALTKAVSFSVAGEGPLSIAAVHS